MPCLHSVMDLVKDPELPLTPVSKGKGNVTRRFNNTPLPVLPTIQGRSFSGGSKHDGLPAIGCHVGGQHSLGGDRLQSTFHFGGSIAFGAGVGVNRSRVSDSGLQEAKWDAQFSALASVHAADKPLLAVTAGGRDELTDFTLDDFGVVPSCMKFFENFHLSCVPKFRRAVIPKEKLDRTVIDNRCGQLVGASIEFGRCSSKRYSPPHHRDSV